MTDPFAGEFNEVLSALGSTEIPMPAQLEATLAAALTKPEPPARVSEIEAAITQNADEAWSLAMALLADEEAAWQAVVAGFTRLGQSQATGISLADSLRAQAEAALEVARLLAKGGHLPDVCGANLPTEARLGIQLQAGLGQAGVELEGAPDLVACLVAAYPRPGHERGDELCRLLARELLGQLEPEQANALETLRREHPTSATLIKERYAEVAEVPLLVLPRVDELRTIVAERLARETELDARVGAVQLRVTVSCSFCHDGLRREEAVFCSGCLAPHHEECFQMHGECSAPGCGQKKVVRPSAPTAPEAGGSPSRRSRLWPLVAAGLGIGVGAAAMASFSDGFGHGHREATSSQPTMLSTDLELEVAPTPDPAVLREAQLRMDKADAERAAARAENDAVAQALDEKSITLNFDETPFDEAVNFLRDITKLNYVISADAHDLIENEQIQVSLRLREITLTNAIRLILASHEELAYRIEDGVVRIHTRSYEEELLLEVYEVGAILSGVTREKGGFWLEADRLIELLEFCLGEHDMAGSVEITGSTLIVRKTHASQQKTLALLAYLRAGSTGATPESTPVWINELEQKLDRNVTVNFADAPLSDVVTFLQDLTGANITVSSSVDAEAQAVSLRLREVPLRDALMLILEQTGLASVYKNETLMITAPEAARGEYFLEILDVADIAAWMDPDALVEVVANAVGEDMWDDPASIDCHHQQLILNQTKSLHEEVGNVLAKLRISRLRNLEQAQGE